MIYISIKEKTCTDCLWSDVCSQKSECDCYTSLGEDEDISIAEYEDDLKLRVEEYEELIKEQDM